MKKLMYLMISLLATFGATADNYFTIDGVANDTLRISPTNLNGYVILYFNANFEGYLDSWRLDLTYPRDTVMKVIFVSRESGMNIPYLKSDGTNDIYEATLTITPRYGNVTYNGEVTLSSITNQYGYWDPDNDGIYESYGTVKWDPGWHNEMFRIDYQLLADCTGDSIVIDGHLVSTEDLRGDTVNADFEKVIYLKVAYLLGDVNGDDSVTLADVTALTNYILTNGNWFDQYQFAAADVNFDGNIGVKDISRLIAMVIAQGTASIEDINELLPNIDI